jgi:hypothetical protein
MTSLLYYTSHIISNHFYIYKHVLSEMDIYLSKRKEKTLTFETYLVVRLLNQNEGKYFKKLNIQQHKKNVIK